MIFILKFQINLTDQASVLRSLEAEGKEEGGWGLSGQSAGNSGFRDGFLECSKALGQGRQLCSSEKYRFPTPPRLSASFRPPTAE